MAKTESSIEINDISLLSVVFGKLDENINLVEREFNVNIKSKDDKILIIGEEDPVCDVDLLLKNLIDTAKKQKNLSLSDVRYAISLIKNNEKRPVSELLKDTVVYTSMGKPIRAKTLGQKRYIDNINDNDIVFGIGPAGTGKTYLAMAAAVRAFKAKEVNRIILTRPAVEAGENLGFLPGDLQNKVDPYLRPLYDALFEILGHDTYNNLFEKGLIEVAPLAYMRGRTLDSAFVILDEAQNTTNEQMKMFLTRLGYGSKAIITGDVTQIDLPRGKQSGLKTVLRILANVKGIGITYLNKNDIVRHPLVQRIIDAYEKYEKTNEKAKKIINEKKSNIKTGKQNENIL
ncbi:MULTISPECIES: PhoH family protein [Peptoniphilus]|uniref:PhoH family protein n=1 Tax=Peptoniphilus TaxID=162289 RepID=UPI0002882151|nr:MULTISPECIES: PhoH family protein [Peptoniphilus]MDU1043264.1 PhoH family protein [Peptoniphilus rhinitidis]MDU1953981.1 PhoH family protein [Peptoniphilus lacydonensis]MDU2109481.1 PhoH family protein [Peptoniphilus lacydonensis]MDU2115219.1 PhoH family protein [Peptoniphilus lacydonensis]MDU5275134.1 PhoH family protein [Peptoniphilus lacydonensis]